MRTECYRKAMYDLLTFVYLFSCLLKSVTDYMYRKLNVELFLENIFDYVTDHNTLLI